TEVKLWDATTGRQLPLRLDGAADRERLAALSPDGTRLAVTRGNHTVTLWTLATGAAVPPDRPPGGAAFPLGFHPDGHARVSLHGRTDITEWYTGLQTAIRVWDADTRAVVLALDGLSCIDGLPSFSPDGTHLAAALVRRGIVRVWDVKTGQDVSSFPYAGVL